MRLRPGVPVLARDQSTAQVGLADPVVLRDLTAEQMAWIASLEGTGAKPATEEADVHLHLSALLASHGLIDSDASAEACGVRIHGAGPLAMTIARGLIRSGLHSLVMVDPAPAHVEPDGTYALGAAGSSCAAAAAWTLRDLDPQLRWGDAVGDMSLEVMIAVGTPPPTLTAACMVAERPHLAVTTDEAGVTVGPLITPGRTACARCMDLHRTDDDPHWPHLALQCGPPRRPWVPPTSLELVAGVAVREIVAHVEGHLLPGRQWRVPHALSDGTALTPTTVRAHPQCGCGAAGPVGDEVAARRAHFGVVRDPQ